MVDAVATSCAKIKQAIRKSLQTKIQPSDNTQELLQRQLSSAQSDIWRMSHDLERAKEEKEKLLSSISNYFHSVAKPATESEILKWEKGATNSYPDKPKIRRHNVYFIDRDIIIPPLYGAHLVSVIIAEGVIVHGLDQWSHNSIYFMDGFRKND